MSFEIDYRTDYARQLCAKIESNDALKPLYDIYSEMRRCEAETSNLYYSLLNLQDVIKKRINHLRILKKQANAIIEQNRGTIPEVAPIYPSVHSIQNREPPNLIRINEQQLAKTNALIAEQEMLITKYNNYIQYANELLSKLSQQAFSVLGILNTYRGRVQFVESTISLTKNELSALSRRIQESSRPIERYMDVEIKSKERQGVARIKQKGG